MSAHDQIRAMLDQLMGTSRNGEEEKLSIKFDDARVCKSFLMACCPHEILASTRMDLGECAKFHNLALRADYEIASENKDYFYDLDALEQLSIFVGEADRKTEQARKRLAETQEELSTDVAVKADKVHELAEKIGEALARAEQLGAEGEVDASMKIMEEIEALRKQKAEAEAEYRISIPAAQYQQQKLRVCDVCCAYLGIHDNDRRLADHFGGKLHLGFIKIRETLKEFQMKEVSEERRKKRREQLRVMRQEEEEKSRKREREMREQRERKRSRSRSAGRDDRRREREDRKKRRSRSRSKSRDRRKRSRSRSKDRKRSHKDKKRSRSRERNRDRSRSKDKERKSRHSNSAKKESKEGSPVATVSAPAAALRNSSISGEESGEI